MAKTEKTNAMRLLGRAHVPYEAVHYESQGEALDALSVAEQIGEQPEMVYKTLVLQGNDMNYYVCVIPAKAELDLKRAAAAFQLKSLRMLHVDEIRPVTGFVRGGCSPLGMKKHYQTMFDESCTALPYVLVSAGQIGTQIKAKPGDIIKVCGAKTAHLIRD